MRDRNELKKKEDPQGRSALRRAVPSSVNLNRAPRLRDVVQEGVDLSSAPDSDGWYPRFSEDNPPQPSGVADAFYEEVDDPRFDTVYVAPSDGMAGQGEGEGVVRQAGLFDVIDEGMSLASRKAMELIVGKKAVEKIVKRADTTTTADKDSLGEIGTFQLLDERKAEQEARELVERQDKGIAPIASEIRVMGTSRIAPSFARLGAAFGVFSDPNLHLPGSMTEFGSVIDPSISKGEFGPLYSALSVKNRIDAYNQASRESLIRYPEKSTIRNMLRKNVMIGVQEIPTMLIAGLAGPNTALLVGSGFVADQSYQEAIVFNENNPDKAAAYAMGMGAIDVTISKSFGKVFGEGFEGMFKNRVVSPAALRTFKDNVRGAIADRIGLTARNVPDWFIGQATPEMLEEATAEVAQQLLTAGFEIDPNAANWEELSQSAIDGAVAALFLTGTTRLAQGFKRSLKAMTPAEKAFYDQNLKTVEALESQSKKIREEQRVKSLESIESKKEQFIDQMKPDPRSAAQARARSLNIAIQEGYNKESPDSIQTRFPDPNKPPVKVTMKGDRLGRVFKVESLDMMTGMLTIVDTSPARTEISASGNVIPRPRLLVSPSRLQLDKSTVTARENADPILQEQPSFVQPRTRSNTRTSVSGRAAPRQPSGVPKKALGRSLPGRSQQRGQSLGSRRTEASRIAEESQAIREENRDAQAQMQPSPDPVIETEDLALPIQKVFTEKDSEALDSVVLDIIRHNFLFSNSGYTWQNKTRIKDVVEKLSQELNVDKTRMGSTFLSLASKGQITIDEETKTVAPSRIFTELYPERQKLSDRTRPEEEVSQEEKIKALRDMGSIDESVITRDLNMRGVSEKFIDTADGRVIVRASTDSNTGETTVTRIAPQGFSNKNFERTFASGTRPAVLARAVTDLLYDAAEFHGLSKPQQQQEQDTPAGGMERLVSQEQKAAEDKEEEAAIQSVAETTDADSTEQDPAVDEPEGVTATPVIVDDEQDVVSEEPSETTVIPSGEVVDAMSSAYTQDTEFPDWRSLADGSDPVQFIDPEGVQRTATAYKPETGEVAYEFDGDEYTLGYDQIQLPSETTTEAEQEPVVTESVVDQEAEAPATQPEPETITQQVEETPTPKKRKKKRKSMTPEQRREVLAAMGVQQEEQAVEPEPAPTAPRSEATQALIDLLAEKGLKVKDKLKRRKRIEAKQDRLGRDAFPAKQSDLIGQDVLEVAGNYILDKVDNDGVETLDEIISDVASIFGDDQAYLLEKPISQAWSKLGELGFVEPMPAEDMARAFEPYRRKASDESVRSGGRSVSAGTQQGQGDQSAAVPRSPSREAQSGSTRGRPIGGQVSPGVGGTDGTAAVSGRRPVSSGTSSDRPVSGGAVQPQRSGSGDVSSQGQSDRRSTRRPDSDNNLTDVLRTDVRSAGLTEKYTPVSEAASAGVLVPKNHAKPLQRILSAILKRRNYLPAFVAKELGIPISKVEGKGDTPGAFYAEQIDALAMAIDAHQRGQGFVLGDMTGIGKGRVVAGLIAYARKQKMVPVFVTQSPGLYSAMMQDLHNIGAYESPNDFNPYITNALLGSKSPDLHSEIQSPGFDEAKVQSKTAQQSFEEMNRIKSSKGKLVDGDTTYDAVFTTYDQLRPQKGKTPRHDFIDGISENAFFIFDESHGIGTGTSRNPDGTEKFTTGSFFRDIIKNAKGAAFSSATFAKRSDSLKTYVSAGLNISLDNPNVLLDLFDRGGDALLQIASQMMVENGNMRRLERDFAGINFSSNPIDINLSNVDNVSNVLNKLDQVSKKLSSSFAKYKDSLDIDGVVDDDLESFLQDSGIPVKRGRSVEVVKATHVAKQKKSDLWRVVNTLQSALKTEEAVRQAVESVKKGEKVVLVFDETKQEAIRDFAARRGITDGQQINFTFREYLQDFINDFKKVRVVRADADGDQHTVIETIPDEKLDPEVKELIDDAMSLAEGIGLDVSGSPIDAVASRLSELGIEYGELTGRQNIIQNENGVPIYAKRSKDELGAAGKNRTISRFNNDTGFNVVLVNRAIAEGYSLHASREFDDQRPRKMIVVDLPADINKVIQLFGRINRANQSSLPSYSVITTNSPSENRMASILSAKMKSLNASATGGTESATSLDIPDYYNFVGEYVLNDVLLDMRAEDIDVFKMTGKSPLRNTEESVRKRMEGDMSWFRDITGKMARLPVSVQAEVWDRLANDYSAEIERLDQVGHNPLTAKVYDFEAKVIDEEVMKAPADPSIQDGQFGSGVKLQRIEARNPEKLMNERNIVRQVSSSLGGMSETQVAEQIRSNAEQEGNAYLDQRLQLIRESDMSDAEKESSSRDMRRFVSSRLANIETISKYLIGQHVVFNTIGRNQVTGRVETVSSAAVILDHDRGMAGTAADPTNLRNRHITVAVADERGSVRIPYSHLAEGKYSIEPSSMTRNEVMRIFNQKKAAPTTQRYIATGDTIAAFEMFSGYGNVGYYTTSAGQTKPAVIMPLDFDPDQWAESRPVNVRNEDSATEILLQGTGLSFLNGNGTVVSHPDGLLLTMPAEVSGNGVKEIRQGMKDIGVEFEAFGQEKMRAELGTYDQSRRWQSVLQQLIKLNGGRLQTTSNHRESRRTASVMEGLVVETDGTNELGMERDLFSPVKSARRLGRRARAASRQRQGRARPPKGTVKKINPKITTDKRGGKEPSAFDVAPVHEKTNDLRELSLMNDSLRGGSLHDGDPESRALGIASQTVANNLDSIFGVKTVVGRLSPSDAFGYFANRAGGLKAEGHVRMARYASALVGARLHEMAHAVDRRHSITMDYLGERQASELAMEQLKALDYDESLVASGNGRSREGWAELFRRFITETTMVDSQGDAASGLQADFPEAVAFMEDILNQNQDLKQQVREAQRIYKMFESQGVSSQVESQIAQPAQEMVSPTVSQRMIDTFDAVASAVNRHSFNKYTRVTDFDYMSPNTVKNNGFTLTDSLINRMSVANAQARSAMKGGVFNPRTGGLYFLGDKVEADTAAPDDQSNIAIEAATAKAAKGDARRLKRLYAFGLARHTMFVTDENSDYNDNVNGEEGLMFNTGMTREQAEFYMEKIRSERPEDYAEFVEWSEKISDTGLAILTMKRDAGILDPVEYRRLYDKYHKTKNYFPMQRILTAKTTTAIRLDGIGIPSPPSGKSKLGVKSRSRYGNGYPVEDPLISLQTQMVEAYSAASEAESTLYLYDAVARGLDEGLGEFVTILEEDTVVTQQQLKDIVKQLEDRRVIDPQTKTEVLAVNRFEEAIRNMGIDKTGRPVPDDLEGVGAPTLKTLAAMLGLDPKEQGVAQQIYNNMQSANSVYPSTLGFLSSFHKEHQQEVYNEKTRIAYRSDGKKIRIEVQDDLFNHQLRLVPNDQHGLFLQALRLAAKTLKFGAVGNIDFAVQDIGVNYSGATTRSEHLSIKESLVNPFVELYKRFGKRFPRRVVKAAVDIAPFIPDSFSPDMVALDKQDTLYGFLQKQGASAFTETGDFVISSTKRKRMQRRVLKTAASEDSFQSKVIRLKANIASYGAEVMAGLSSPETRSRKSLEVFVDSALALYDRGLLKPIEGLVQMSSDFSSATDMPARLANARGALSEMGWQSLKNGAWKTPEGNVVYKLPPHVSQKIMTAYANGGLNHRHGGEFTSTRLNKFIPFANTIIQGYWTELRLAKMATVDPLARLAPIPEAARKRILGKAGEKGSPVKAAGILSSRLAVRYLRLMALEAAAHALYYYFVRDDEAYKNADKKERDNYYLLSDGNKVIVRVKKNPQLRVPHNLSKYAVDKLLGERERNEVGDSLLNAALIDPLTTAGMDMVNSAPGLFRLPADVYRNKNYWDRYITPPRERNLSPSLMDKEGLRTTFLARMIAQVGPDSTRSVFNPYTVDYMLNGITANQYRYFASDLPSAIGGLASGAAKVVAGDDSIAESIEDVNARDVTRLVPGVSTVIPMRVPTGPVHELEKEVERRQVELANMEAMELSDTAEYRSLELQKDVANYMSDIATSLVISSYTMEGKYQNQLLSLAVGTARDALGMEEVDMSRSALEVARDSVPVEVADEIDRFMRRMTEGVFPVTQNEYDEGSTALDRKMKMLDIISNKIKFLRLKMRSPYVQEYITNEYAGKLDRMFNDIKDDPSLTALEQAKYRRRYKQVELDSFDLLRETTQPQL